MATLKMLFKTGSSLLGATCQATGDDVMKFTEAISLSLEGLPNTNLNVSYIFTKGLTSTLMTRSLPRGYFHFESILETGDVKVIF